MNYTPTKLHLKTFEAESTNEVDNITTDWIEKVSKSAEINSRFRIISITPYASNGIHYRTIIYRIADTL